MKVIIAGSRALTPDLETIAASVKASAFGVTKVVYGCAAGVDTAGERWAESYDFVGTVPNRNEMY